MTLFEEKKDMTKWCIDALLEIVYGTPSQLLVTDE